MKAYYLVFFLALMVSLFYQAKTDKQWRWKLFWTFLPLLIYGAIRVDYGNDYSSYEELFDHIHSYSNFKLDKDLHAELGYQLLNKILPSYRSLLVLNSFMLSLSLAFFCYHNITNKYLWLAVILIFLNPEKNIFGSLVGIRNGLVVTSFLLGSVFLQKRKYIFFAALTIFLSTIHTSALIFLPLAYVAGYNKPFTKKELWVWFAIIITLLFASMTQIADIISAFLENDQLERYNEVLEESGKHRGLLMVISSQIFTAIFIFFLYRQNHSLLSDQRSLLRVGILFSVMMLMGSLSMRTSYFYDMFFIASIVIVCSEKKFSKELRFLSVTLALISSAYSMYIWMSSPWWDHAVYHSLLGSW